LPAELPKFQCKGQLGDTSARSLHEDDGGDGRLGQARSLSSAADAAGGGEAVLFSASRSANDSSMLDVDMDET